MKKYFTLNIQYTQKLFFCVILTILSFGQLLEGHWIASIINFFVSFIWINLLIKSVENELTLLPKILNWDKSIVILLILMNAPGFLSTPFFFMTPLCLVACGYLGYELFKLNVSQEKMDKIKGWFYK